MRKIKYTKFRDYEQYIVEEDIQPPWAFWLGVVASVLGIISFIFH